MRRRIGFMALVAIALGPAARGVSAGTVRKPRLDLEVRCATIHAFDYEPTSKELQDALDRIGARGATRLDLGLTHEARPAAPESLPDDAVPSGERPTQPLPTWQKPVEAARAIAAAKTMSGVEELKLDRFPLTEETTRILASSAYVAGLESLSLERAGLTARVLAELLAPRAFPGLVELNLTNNRLRAADLDALATHLADRKLRRLDIGARRDFWPTDSTKQYLARDAAAIAALARVAAAPGLALLDLHDEPVGFATLKAILETGRKAPLEVHLEDFPRLNDAQMAALAALDPDGRVTFAIGDLGKKELAVIRALDKSGLLAKVTALDLGCGDACAKVIARSANTARLRELVFSCSAGVAFTKTMATALSRPVGLPALRELAFIGEPELCEGPPGLGLDGLRALLKAPFAGQLESLRLEDQDLNGVGIIELARASSLRALKRLWVVEDDPILNAANIWLLFRDGALASHLELLSLQNESASGWPIAQLATGLKMPKLRALELPSAHASLPEWLKLARAPGWRSVRALGITIEIEGEEGHDEAGRGQVIKALRKSLAPGACLPAD